MRAGRDEDRFADRSLFNGRDRAVQAATVKLLVEMPAPSSLVSEAPVALLGLERLAVRQDQQDRPAPEVLGDRAVLEGAPDRLGAVE